MRIKDTRLAFVCLLIMVVLACAGCAASQKAEQGVATESEGGQAAAVDKAVTSEGVYTPCEVSFSPYDGDHADMFLREGDAVAVISPSALPTQEQVDATVEGLKSWGYVPVLSKHVCESGRTLEDCMEDLVWALEDENVKAVFCVRGGYGASEVADRLSLDLIPSANKFIIGYSDITVFHSAWTSAGIPSVHACMSATFDDLTDACADAERRLLAGEIPSYTCSAIDLCKEGEADGVLVGGNLSTFTAVLDTAYDCTRMDEPYILFLEDVGEDMRHLHRCLTVLKHLGVLDRAQGIVFGEWTDLPADEADYGGSSRGGTFSSVANMIARQITDDVDVPVAFGFPAGHGDVNYPLLMGSSAHLSVGEGSYTLDWKARQP